VPRARRSDAVFQFGFTSAASAVDATENLALLFNTVTDDPAVAMGANRRERVDRALEAIERVPLPGDG